MVGLVYLLTPPHTHTCLMSQRVHQLREHVVHVHVCRCTLCTYNVHHMYYMYMYMFHYMYYVHWGFILEISWCDVLVLCYEHECLCSFSSLL